MTETSIIVRTLCDHAGCLDLQRLTEALTRASPGAERLLRSALSDRDKIAIRPGKRKATGGLMIGPDSLIVAKTSLRICQKKSGGCQQCDGLHLCRYFVCGSCTFGPSCKNPHSVASPYNTERLQRHGLHDLTEKQLFQLLLQNDPYLLPEICPHYNKGTDVHGACKFSTSCTKLHVCQHYLQGDCKFGASCKRVHNIDAQGMKILRGLSQENIKNLPDIYRNKCIIRSQTATAVPAATEVNIPTQQPSQSSHGAASSACPSKAMTDAERNEICLFFIRRHCSFKDKCARVHWHIPYRWQVLDSDGVTWKDLPKMEDIEKAYCDPARDSDCVTPAPPPSGMLGFFGFKSSSPAGNSVDFMTMRYRGSPVRRLSTASAVSKPPHFILTTQWLWYWKDDGGQWQEFGKGDVDNLASVTSETLENIYLADRDTEIPFCAGNQQYLLHFGGGPGTQQIYQENIKYKTKREVRRRPRFVSAQDVRMQLESASPHSSGTSVTEIVPSHWDKNAIPEFGYMVVPLSKSAKDYTMIEMLFKRTMPLAKINSIQRIQNPSLWKVFQWQKEQMMERNGRKPVNEQYLFHGTDESLIGAICEQNFDWRMCGVHGVAYGKGSYFARDASYSNKYVSTKKASMNKTMFVALVLVGEYSTGSSNFVRPPPKGNSHTLYDSCVDSELNPSIFVVFEKQQIYPEYLICYA